MLRRPSPRLIFGSAIFLLLVCGVASAWTLYRIYSGETWVRHTYKVQVLLGDIVFDLDKSGRDRQDYLRTGDQQYLKDIEEIHRDLQDEVKQLKLLVNDSVDQQRASEKLERVINGRLHTLDESIGMVKSGKSTHEAQDAYTLQLVRWSQQSSDIATEMQDAESRLLDRRLLLTNSLFIWIVTIFTVTFVLSLYMLWEHYRGLNRELTSRRVAERNAQNLSSQLLKAQDQERRRIARDLHDGLGQNLAAAKMIADSFVNHPSEKQHLLELSALLDDAVASIRSISHLLHPPLVDEIGFACAARTYLEGFSRRSGVQVNFDVPDEKERLPRDLELVLFRVLQEALTNIQRHSKSTRAEVLFRTDSKTASLTIRDHGVGLPAEALRNFKENGLSTGVGLAGMKERMREQNGHFEIHSDSRGTFISATFPVVPDSSALSH